MLKTYAPFDFRHFKEQIRAGNRAGRRKSFWLNDKSLVEARREVQKWQLLPIGRNVAGPLLFLNLIMYFIVMVFAVWAVNRYINDQTYHPSLGGNGATTFFLTFAILASVVGPLSIIAWAITALAFEFACKEIGLGGHRGWSVIILTFTQLLYVMLIHAGIFSSRYGPGYRETEYGLGATPADAMHRGTGLGATGTRV